MILKKTKRMDAVFFVWFLWLVFRPEMKVKSCSIAPYKCPFGFGIREPQPRMFPAVKTLNVNILLLIVDTGKICSQADACSLAIGPWITGRYFSVAIPIEIFPFILANIWWDKWLNVARIVVWGGRGSLRSFPRLGDLRALKKIYSRGLKDKLLLSPDRTAYDTVSGSKRLMKSSLTQMRKSERVIN